MKISMLGSGRWGSFIAWYLSGFNEVTVWTRPDSEKSCEFIEKRGNDLVHFDENVEITTDLEKALDTDTVIISISSQGLREFASKLSQYSPERERRFVLCMKGLEEKTGKRLSEVFREGYGRSCQVAVWIGPGHVQDFTAGIPNCMVIDSDNEELKRELCNAFSTPLIRFYYGRDLIGNEVGAASKNVIGIAAGMLDGFGFSSLKGALMSRGAHEISRLIGKMGGDPMSAYGLCHLGDYEATVFSPHSHNRAYGEAFVKGEKFSQLAEGVMTCKAMEVLAQKYSVELPICRAVYAVLFENADPQKTLNSLFEREMKNEF
jgi:glycerol-3-phosphate dehydrogenase (NAD(P)+)